MAYGVTPAGFTRPRFPEIRSQIAQTLRENLISAGYPGEILTTPDTVFGILIDTFAEREAAIWEKAEEVFLSRFPSSARGKNLDRLLELGGHQRLGTIYSTTFLEVELDGPSFQPIPAGFRLRDRFTERVWGVSKPITDPLENITRVKFHATNFDPQTLYSFSFGDFSWSTPPTAWQVTDEVAQHVLLYSISQALQNAGINVEHEESGGLYTFLTVTTHSRLSVAASLSSSFTATEITAVVPATVLQPYNDSPIAGTPFDPVDATSYWLSSEVFIQGIIGSLEQDDADFLSTYRAGGVGVSTLPAIDANLRSKVPTIIESAVYQNTSDVVSPEGMLPRSIYAVVLGGDSGEIAQALYELKAAGIDTNSLLDGPNSQIVTLVTPQGLQTISFDRPEPVYIWVEVVVTPITDPPSGEWPSADGELLVIEGVREYFRSFETVGKDVRYQILMGGVYRYVPGVGSVELRIAASTDPSTTRDQLTFSSSNIEIAFNQIARLADVYVEVV